MDLIFKHPNKLGRIYQSGYREIPHDLLEAKIDLVIYAARGCPPLNHHRGAELKYHPNEDIWASKGTAEYAEMYRVAGLAALEVAEAVKEGKRVLVTCSQGINRSSLVTGLALRLLTQLSGQDIVSLIRQNRSGTLTNNAFVEMILSGELDGQQI